MQKTYETDRLILRVLDKTYAQLILYYYSNNRSFLDEWEPLKNEGFYTKKYHEDQLEDDLFSMENGNSFRLWIYKRNDYSRIIGCIGFSNIVKGAFFSCHLGYKLDKDEINKGYMTLPQ